jgi:release factor glutamine methyltransferase
VKSILTTGKSLWQWRRWAVANATAHDIAPYEIDWLLQRVANLEPLTLRLESIGDEEAVSTSMPLDRLSELWLERVNSRKPVQYLLGVTTWRDFELIVSPAVLIPRPETESMVEIALEHTTLAQQRGKWVELGTGSGAISIGLARALPNTQIHATDYSSAALAIAQLNAARLGANNISFSQGDWWSSLTALRGSVSLAVSNPPYIPSQELLQLQPEVVNHEPHLALDGGSDGLEAMRILVDTSADYLQPAGILLLEMMAGQGDAIVDLLVKKGEYYNIQVIPDLAGLDRFVICQRT